jgi:hypothetical protein
MNEHVDDKCGVLVAASRSEPRHLGTNYFIDRAALEETINRLISMPASAKVLIGQAARARFQEIDRDFQERVRKIFGKARPTA